MTSAMKRVALLSIVFPAAISIVNANEDQKNTSLNGFVVWAEGSGCDRELKFNEIVDGTVGQKQTAVEKGEAADIHVHISYDGVWIAFSRATKRWDGRYGDCDYHDFDNFDIYIAKIDNGKNLPAKAIKIDHGYWTSWGEDATDPDCPKTLYYCNYKDKSIMKTIVLPDGTFSPPVKHADVPGGMSHVQCSPDGKFILHRPGRMKVYSIEQNKTISGDLGGCHPSWGPRSKYFIRAQNGAYYNTGTSVKSLGSAGLGKYWYGISNDAFYDQGKLWIIGKMGGGGQNDAGPVEFREVDITNGGWKLGPTTKVGQGTTADIHIYGSSEDLKNMRNG